MPAQVAHGKLRLRGHCTEPSWHPCPVLRQAGPPRVMPGNPLAVFSTGAAKKNPPALFPPASPEGAATLTFNTLDPSCLLLNFTCSHVWNSTYTWVCFPAQHCLRGLLKLLRAVVVYFLSLPSSVPAYDYTIIFLRSAGGGHHCFQTSG